MKELELTGKVILDDETMSRLKRKIRKEVVAEIKADGLSSAELIKIFGRCDTSSQFDIIRDLFDCIKEPSEGEPFYNGLKKAYDALNLCKQVLIVAYMGV